MNKATKIGIVCLLIGWFGNELWTPSVDTALLQRVDKAIAENEQMKKELAEYKKTEEARMKERKQLEERIAEAERAADERLRKVNELWLDGETWHKRADMAELEKAQLLEQIDKADKAVTNLENANIVMRQANSDLMRANRLLHEENDSLKLSCQGQAIIIDNMAAQNNRNMDVIADMRKRLGVLEKKSTRRTILTAAVAVAGVLLVKAVAK